MCIRDSSGTTVKDKSPYNNNGTIEKVNETTIGIDGGAPAGPTPLTALQFNKGLINVPGVDFNDVINGTGSYTMSAWIKPVGLFAPSFIFGQTNQGIYNGIRDFGFLHQAHWKIGTNSKGKTDLNTYLENDEDGWIHATWVYDGSTDMGYMYLDGEIDWSGQKDSPTGSGNLILGARNGGEQGYVGLIDEVAVWKRALPQNEIKQLVSGKRPFDGDFNGNGMGDEWEKQYSITDPDADLDGDGLSNVQEFQKGTDPSQEDTDGDLSLIHI